MRTRLGVSLALVGLSMTVFWCVTKAADDGFTPLFNGKDFTGFGYILADGRKGTDFSTVDTWRIENGTIVCSGKPNGYFYTLKSYRNYHLRFQARFAPTKENPESVQLNSGYLVHIQGEHKVWPTCVEVQGLNRDMCNIFDIGGLKGGKYTNDAQARKRVRKPLGEWNTIEIISDNGHLTSKLNGTVIGHGTAPVREGPIGWQSEGAEIHFRDIAIKLLP
mgnify:CR=1 FL=1